MHFLVINSAEFMIYLGAIIITVILSCLLIRWAVRSDTMINNQNATIYLLMKLCIKHGVPEGEIAELKDHFKIK